MCRTIKHIVKFKAAPVKIYNELAANKKIGARFTADRGATSGLNVDLKRGERIVLAWRNKKFPAGIFSMAAFVLEPTPSGGTKLTLTHRGVPKQLIPSVEQFWRDSYWSKLKKL